MNIPRITETIVLLRSIPQDRFNYTEWGSVPEENCKTLACAAGYMTLHKPFQQQGLNHSPISLAPYFRKLRGEEALAEFLDISNDEAECIFINLHVDLDIEAEEVTPTHVAEALQQLIIEHR